MTNVGATPRGSEWTPMQFSTIISAVSSFSPGKKANVKKKCVGDRTGLDLHKQLQGGEKELTTRGKVGDNLLLLSIAHIHANSGGKMLQEKLLSL